MGLMTSSLFNHRSRFEISSSNQLDAVPPAPRVLPPPSKAAARAEISEAAFRARDHDIDS
jgi:hypothetical protein